MKTILMTGVTGFAGRHIATELMANGYRLSAIGRGERPEFLPPDSPFFPGDLDAAEGICRQILLQAPDMVVHSAAMSKPNDCEGAQALTLAINTEATAAIANACRESGSKLVFMSTDFVFGDHGPYAEDDEYCPQNFYGQSKALAEEAIRDAGVDHLIIRTVLVYGQPFPGQSPSFVQWVVNQLKEGRNIRVYTDQQRTATYAPDLARGIRLLLQKNASGTFHVCGNEVWTPFSMACEVAEHCGLDKGLIHPTTSEERPEPARRPARATLLTDRLANLTGFKPTPLREALSVILPME